MRARHHQLAPVGQHRDPNPKTQFAIACCNLDLGIDPSALIRGLMGELHLATRTKAGASAEALPVEQREAAERLADQLGWGQIHRVWQMLLKGLSDVQVAPDPREAAMMALLRLIHAADLPDPATVMSRLSGEAATATPVRAAALDLGKDEADSGEALLLTGLHGGDLRGLDRITKHGFSCK